MLLAHERHVLRLDSRDSHSCKMSARPIMKRSRAAVAARWDNASQQRTEQRQRVGTSDRAAHVGALIKELDQASLHVCDLLQQLTAVLGSRPSAALQGARNT